MYGALSQLLLFAWASWWLNILFYHQLVAEVNWKLLSAEQRVCALQAESLLWCNEKFIITRFNHLYIPSPTVLCLGLIVKEIVEFLSDTRVQYLVPRSELHIPADIRSEELPRVITLIIKITILAACWPILASTLPEVYYLSHPFSVNIDL